MEKIVLNGKEIEVTGQFFVLEFMHGITLETVDPVEDFIGADGQMMRVNAILPDDILEQIDYKNFISLPVGILNKYLKK